MKIEMPDAARHIIEELNKEGFEAYIVGGCVRDSLLNKTPDDWDITTSAEPYQVKEIFKRTIDTGIEHGTVTVMFGKEGYEVTTYRIDGKYENHRRPESVSFTKSLEEDLKRRDFTINAMAYNDETGLVDLFGGMEDLEKRVIRCVGNPIERFNEDALRILRAVRFAAQLGFEIDEETECAIKNLAKDLKEISAERIQTELTKLITSDNPGMLETAYRLGITAVILPEFDLMMETPQNIKHHIYDVGHHTLKVMENVPKDKVLRYAALLHDSGKPASKKQDDEGFDHFAGHNVISEEIADKVLKRLKMDNDTIKKIKNLVYWHDYGIGGEITIKSFRRAMSKMGIENFSDFIAIRRADMLAQSMYKREEKEENIRKMKEMYDTVVSEKQCLKIKDLAINGNDLIALGMKPGKEMGETLKYLLDKVLENPELNERETLIELVKAMK